MKTVLITGALGFIGSKMVEKFHAEKYKVFAWDQSESTKADVEIQKIDLANTERILMELNRCRPDIVIHCAGAADVSRSVNDPAGDYQGNVTITHNLLFCLHRAGMDHVRFVFLSSASVYGNPLSLPITEDMPVNPLSPYAVHKVMCEDLCKFFSRTYGMDMKIARIFSAYGSGLKKQIFWDMYNKAYKTGRLVMSGTGHESRDYIHVDDVVKALYLLATVETNEMIFNVANGEETTIRQATELFADCAGIDRENIEFNGIGREGDPINWRADITRIQNIGYKESVCLPNGLLDYVAWVKGVNI